MFESSKTNSWSSRGNLIPPGPLARDMEAFADYNRFYYASIGEQNTSSKRGRQEVENGEDDKVAVDFRPAQRRRADSVFTSTMVDGGSSAMSLANKCVIRTRNWLRGQGYATRREQGKYGRVSNSSVAQASAHQQASQSTLGVQPPVEAHAQGTAVVAFTDPMHILITGVPPPAHMKLPLAFAPTAGHPANTNFYQHPSQYRTIPHCPHNVPSYYRNYNPTIQRVNRDISNHGRETRGNPPILANGTTLSEDEWARCFNSATRQLGRDHYDAMRLDKQEQAFVNEQDKRSGLTR
jgi:hypothetical protein